MEKKAKHERSSKSSQQTSQQTKKNRLIYISVVLRTNCYLTIELEFNERRCHIYTDHHIQTHMYTHRRARALARGVIIVNFKSDKVHCTYTLYTASRVCACVRVFLIFAHYAKEIQQ